MSEVIHYGSESDKQIIDFSLLPAVAMNWPDEKPIWCMIIGPPSSAKTFHIELLRGWEQSVFLSSLSENSLISGYRDPNDPDADFSLLPQLDRKLLIIKDFTTIMDLGKEKLRTIMGQFRDVYDGDMSRAFGNQAGLAEYQARFNLLLAVTPVIDSFYSINTQLGERFISRREYVTNRMEAVETAVDSFISGNNQGNKVREIQTQVTTFIKDLPKVQPNALRIGEVPWFHKRAKELANFVALARSHVVRDKGGNDTASISMPEIGPRLGLQLIQCMAAFQVLNGYALPNEHVWDFGARIARDTLPLAVAVTLYAMYKLHQELDSVQQKERMTLKEIMGVTRIGYRMTKQIIDDLHLNYIVNAEYKGDCGLRGTTYYIAPWAVEAIEQFRLFDNFDVMREFDAGLPERIHLAREKQKGKS